MKKEGRMQPDKTKQSAEKCNSKQRRSNAKVEYNMKVNMQRGREGGRRGITTLSLLRLIDVG